MRIVVNDIVDNYFFIFYNEHSSLLRRVMQTKKIELKNRIMEVAKEEFLKNGYKKTSLRKIAKVLNISHSNIMTYFKNKEDLFNSLVIPAMDFMNNSLVQPVSSYEITDEVLLSYIDFEAVKKRHIKLFKEINNLSESLVLLLFHSEEYDYKGIRKNSEELFYNTLDDYLEELVRRKLIKKVDVSQTFKRTLSSLFINSIEKIILYDISEEELEKYATEMAIFISYGTNMIIGGKNTK